MKVTAKLAAVLVASGLLVGMNLGLFLSSNRLATSYSKMSSSSFSSSSSSSSSKFLSSSSSFSSVPDFMYESTGGSLRVHRQHDRRLLPDDGAESIADATQCIAGYGGDDAGGSYTSGNPTSSFDITNHTGAPLVTTHGTKAAPTSQLAPGYVEIYPCNRYSANTCCNNVLAEEVAMAFDHFFNTGGSGAGRPRHSEVCKLTASTTYQHLNEYFCLFCNPKAANFFGCCDTTCPLTTEGEARKLALVTGGMSEADALAQMEGEEGGTDDAEGGGNQYTYDRAYTDALRAIPVEVKGAQFTAEKIAAAKATAEAVATAGGGTNYWHRDCGKTCFDAAGEPTYAATKIDDAAGTCTKDNVNVIRVCKTYAERAYIKNKLAAETLPPGELYDGCGSLVWIGGEWSPKNPFALQTWGDVDGTTGDDPVILSQLWGDFETFARDVKPPLFDEFVVIVVPDTADGDVDGGRCFGGRDNHKLDEYVYPYGS